MAKAIGYMKPDIDSNLRLYVPFNEGTGNVAKDYSQYGNHGDFGAGVAAPIRAIGKNGSALDFDGTDDYVDISHSNSLNVTEPCTFSVWFKSNAIGSGSESMLFDKHTPGQHRAYALIVGDDATPDPQEFFFSYYDGAWRNFHTTDANLVIDTWYNIIGVIQDTAPLTADFYLNRILLSDVAGNPANDLPVNSVNLLLGKSGNDNLQFNGTIDEVRIYALALSPAQIAADCYEVVCS